MPRAFFKSSKFQSVFCALTVGHGCHFSIGGIFVVLHMNKTVPKFICLREAAQVNEPKPKQHRDDMGTATEPLPIALLSDISLVEADLLI